MRAIDSVECVVCDGTSTMTGCYNGLIASAEREMNKELQWCICQLHGNETPMRHLFQYLDGGHGTSGPRSFHGPIGKALTSGNCHLKDTIQFIPIKVPDLLVSILVFIKHQVNRSMFFDNLWHYPNICISVTKSDRKAYFAPF